MSQYGAPGPQGNLIGIETQHVSNHIPVRYERRLRAGIESARTGREVRLDAI